MISERFLRGVSGLPVLLAVSYLIGSASAPAADPSSPAVGGCKVFPDNNIWNTPIDAMPVDRASETYIQTIGADTVLHADFGSGTFEGGPIGIPFIVVNDSQPKVHINFIAYGDESDPGPYPIPSNAPIEGGASSTGDRHVLVVDAAGCMLYELYRAFPSPTGWNADSGAVFNLRSNRLRPAGWTSADAAGFAILPGLVRYDEVAEGEIRHALRFTVPKTRKAYVWPATHAASSLTGPQYPAMGQRFRLRADFDESALSLEAQVFARALKKYGMMIADNGSAWFISGAPDERWNNERLRDLRKVKGSDFEAVDQTMLMLDAASGAIRSAVRVVNAASLRDGPVAPNEIVTIFGSGLKAPVTVNGIDAALFYTSETQINALLPAALPSANARIEVGGAGGGFIDVAVASASPAIFTIPSGGAGQGAILNQDYSVNSILNPAARGSVVQIFGTGGGAMTAETTVRIDGAEAEIFYAGSAPLYAGLIQVNAKVPETAAKGNVPVVIRIAGTESQAGVSLAVK
jgi:uncharacterized protein (TIGR03437 family)